MLTSQSYLILDTIIGGQALAGVSNKLNDTLGIVIIGLISFVVGIYIYVCWFEKFEKFTQTVPHLFLSRLLFAATDLYTGIYFLLFYVSSSFPSEFF